MRLVFTLAALASVCWAAVPAMPRFTDPQRHAKLESALPEIEKIFDLYWQQRGIPGLVYGVVIDGQPVVIKAFGVSDRGTNAPVTAETRFRIASMTKSFTSLAILKLRDEGKLSLEDPVSKWIPEFARIAYPTADTAPIRIRELLTHGAGFPEDNPWGDRQLGISDDQLTKWLKEGLPFSTAPNTEFEYSNYGFALLGRIVAKASKMPYKEYLTRQILAPLGMAASTLEGSEVPAAERATGYRNAPGGGSEAEVPPGHGAFGPMGGLWTNARDLAKYVAYQLSAWPPRDDAETGPVRRSSMREMQSAARTAFLRVDRSGPEGSIQGVIISYAFGLNVSRDCRFNHIVGHGGGLPGYGSYMQWLPEYGVGMFAMANLTYAGPAVPMDAAWNSLIRTGGLRPRELPASDTLRTARDQIAGLWNQWSDAAANKLAADNLFLDRPAEVRRKDIERMKSEVGNCGPPGDVDAENWLRGRFRMQCAEAAVDVIFTLAPTMPPRVQALNFITVRKLDPALRGAAESAVALFDPAAEDRFAAAAGPGLDAATARRQAAPLRTMYGKCSVGDVLAADGKSFARIRLNCERGEAEMRLRVDGSGKLASLDFQRGSESACAVQ